MVRPRQYSATSTHTCGVLNMCGLRVLELTDAETGAYEGGLNALGIQVTSAWLTPLA